MTLNDMSKTLSDKVAVHLNLPYELEELRDFNSITAQMMVQIVDMTDSAILQEIINYDKENKICDVYLLDKSFVKNALEKQIPKKVIKQGKYSFVCPYCKQDLGIEQEDISVYDMTPPKHCEHCGQALDWSYTERVEKALKENSCADESM